MRDDELKPPEPKAPGSLLRMNAILFGLSAVICLFLMADSDAKGDYYYFRFFALAFMLVSTVLVVTGYLSIRRSWKREPRADFKDGILPLAIIAALGWGIWTLAHL